MEEVCLQKVHIVCVNFFCKQGVIHKECVPEGKAVNGEFYIQVLEGDGNIF